MRSTVVVSVVLLLCIGAAVFLDDYLGGSGSSKADKASRTPTSDSASNGGARPATSAGGSGGNLSVANATWQLAAPIAGDLVLPGPGTELTVLGGATIGGAPAQGVFALDTSTGTLVHVGNLTTALDDASGAVIGGQDVVFGGSSPGALSTVQSLVQAGLSGAGAGAGAGARSVASAVPLANLPHSRTESAVATIGTTSYLVGGDDDTSALATVLSTTDGKTFRSVAALVKPVRFGAVAAFGDKIYVFGGEGLAQGHATTPVDTIQIVDPKDHRSRVVGHFPEPLSGASAVTVDGEVLILGGITQTGSVQGTGTSHPSGSHSSSPGGYSTSTVGSIWLFDPATDRVSQAGALPEPVSQAGVAVAGSTAWVIGGLTNGTPVSAVQMVRVATPQ